LHGGENLNYGIVDDGSSVFTVGLLSTACSMQLLDQRILFISVDPKRDIWQGCPTRRTSAAPVL